MQITFLINAKRNTEHNMLTLRQKNYELVTFSFIGLY